MRKLSETQLAVLAVAEVGPIVQFVDGWRREGAESAAVTPAFATGTVNSLVSRGYLREAKARPGPRKVVITAAGRAAVVGR